MDRVLDEDGRIVGDLPLKVFRKRFREFVHLGWIGVHGAIAFAPGVWYMASAAAALPLSLVSRSRFAAPSSTRATSPSRSTEPSGLVRMTIFSNSSAEAEAALRLDVELQPLIVGDRPRADTSHRGLHVLGLDGADDIAGRQPQSGELVRVHPGPHRIVLRTPKSGVADAGRGS